ncbi:hypothetical protein TorRG33x02_352180 [Trema orientale]|uniref:Uncharacterized protein n=1 Tax=Trema orientale TaxID=63057 RepID=A0A2P5AEW7_TREOI|nr:hypothetical protein TorRG33x02_352180 [Trema orientale]
MVQIIVESILHPSEFEESQHYMKGMASLNDEKDDLIDPFVQKAKAAGPRITVDRKTIIDHEEEVGSKIHTTILSMLRIKILPMRRIMRLQIENPLLSIGLVML